MENSNKRPLKLNLLGVLKVDTEIDGRFGFIQVMILCALLLIFLLGLVALLKGDILPAVKVLSATKAATWTLGKFGTFFGPRSP